MTRLNNPGRIIDKGIPLLIFVVLTLALSACSANQSDLVIDRSFMTSQPCAAPCWYGLELDKSTREDLNTTLRELPFVDQSSINESVATWQNDEHAVAVWWECLSRGKAACSSRAQLSGNRLKSLSFSIDYSLTFSETVQKLGPPDRVFYDDAFWRGECDLYLFWPMQGISIYGKLPKTCSLNETMQGAPLNPNTPVSRINYDLPALLQTVLKDSRYLAWPGFKEGGLLFLDFVPGGVSTWLMILLGLGIVMVLALWKRSWPVPIFSFILAALFTIEPTIRLQFSDVITPMCGAYFVNVLICGTIYALSAMTVRRLWLHHTKSAVSSQENPSI